MTLVDPRHAQHFVVNLAPFSSATTAVSFRAEFARTNPGSSPEWPSGTSADEGNGDSTLVPPALDAKWRGTMTVTPATAIPGNQVALRFASGQVRGIAFSLSA